MGRNSSDMWLSSFDPKKPTTVTLQFIKHQPITGKEFSYHIKENLGVSIWNYNASPESSYAGVKYANIYVNGKLMVNNVLLRKAPGFVYFDFVQDVFFDSPLSLKVQIPRPSTHSVCGCEYFCLQMSFIIIFFQLSFN